jgi:DNA invertase Pin-like site-specific DNA recombinase
MKVAIYCRVSTDDKNQDPERQIIKCRQYADLHNHEIVGVYKEYHTGDSKPDTRPEFQRLIIKDVEGIIVFSIDRLSRQHPSKIMQLINELKDRGIKVISITEPIFNMESDFAEPMQYFLGWWNNYFLKKLKIDIKSGIEKARKEGKQIGRAKVEFNEFRARQLLAEGKSYSAVAKELDIPKATIYRRFKNLPKYTTGKYINEAGVSETSVFEMRNKDTSYSNEVCPKCKKKQLRWRAAFHTYMCYNCRLVFDCDYKVLGREEF